MLYAGYIVFKWMHEDEPYGNHNFFFPTLQSLWLDMYIT